MFCRNCSDSSLQARRAHALWSQVPCPVLLSICPAKLGVYCLVDPQLPGALCRAASTRSGLALGVTRKQAARFCGPLWVMCMLSWRVSEMTVVCIGRPHPGVPLWISALLHLGSGALPWFAVHSAGNQSVRVELTQQESSLSCPRSVFSVFLLIVES